MFEIKKFEVKDQNQVREFVLNIQNNEFNLGFEAAEQPDLIDIEKFYKSGGFWTAKINNTIVGTIGLQITNEKNGILRKMFVQNELRGKEFHLAQKLFNTLIKFAKNKEINTLWLDTPKIATASHKFYIRNGFEQSFNENLPMDYVFPDRNSMIYKLCVK
ncbi:GNAT family N-acetyltransferase [Halpernia frigidisoli]|uniref:Acetyltransferase (GNAT) family protein n=1 Tax=Halpernia frigidisoli TaxID=1125876 RepID=A0A1I3F1Y7_9FLAO|nr:GNAT family N-acetyltransferase [Halpernia frigidisoli]SFI05244.1 Acetyltransferase (GNAT) family protein [Halpernia frigidisoli]